MVAGGLKTSLAAVGTRLDISIPTAIAGSSYSINTLAGARGIGVPFVLVEHQFLVEVRYRFNT
jgi:CheY-specific phosphatase CheX